MYRNIHLYVAPGEIHMMDVRNGYIAFDKYLQFLFLEADTILFCIPLMYPDAWCKPPASRASLPCSPTIR